MALVSCSLLLGLSSAGASTVAMASPAMAAQQANEGAQRMFNTAENLRNSGQLDEARQGYERLIAQHGESSLVGRALIELIFIDREFDDPASARRRAEELITKFNGTANEAAGRVLIAEVDLDFASTLNDVTAAKRALVEVLQNFVRTLYPTLEWRARARVRLGDANFLLGVFDEAAGDYVSAIEDEPDSALTRVAELGLAKVLLWQNDWLGAARILQDLANRDPDLNPPAVTARQWLELMQRVYPNLLNQPRAWSNARTLAIPFRDPVGIAAQADGTLLVVDENRDLVRLVDPAGGPGESDQVRDARRPFWDPLSGRLALVEKTRINIFRELNRGCGSLAEDRPGDDEPRKLQNLRAGLRGVYREWYILDTSPPAVYVFRPDSACSYYTTLIGRDSQTEIVDIARDLRGQVYALDRRAKVIIRYSADGSPLGNVVDRDDEWNRPEAIDIDALGNIYYLDRNLKEVIVYDRDGNQLHRMGPNIGSIELKSPRDIAVDGSGRIYIADKDLPGVIVIG